VNFDQTVEYLYGLLPVYHRIGAPALKPNLDNTLRLLEALGNPHLGLRSIHIAGTNGKGSTSSMLASVLMEAGYGKVGLYTSPHLKTFTERIRINGIDIPQDWVVQFVVHHKELIESIQPSFFEFTVAMCFAYFAAEKVDWAIIEVGLGGRLDSTNVIRPELTIVTNISFDHKELLGDTLATIAGEKAGIFKPGVPAVVGTVLAETRPVFERMGRQLGVSRLEFAEMEYNLVRRPSDMDLAHFDVFRDEKLIYPDLACDLTGIYQAANLRTVLCALDVLAETQDVTLTEDALRRGLYQVKANSGLRGRMDVLQHQPLVLADVAHNPDGIASVMEQIRLMEPKHLYIVFGMVADKETEVVLRLLPRENTTYFWVKPPLPRGLPAQELKMRAERIGLVGSCIEDIPTALKAAKRVAQSQDIVLVTGSIFVVAEVL